MPCRPLSSRPISRTEDKVGWRILERPILFPPLGFDLIWLTAMLVQSSRQQ